MKRLLLALMLIAAPAHARNIVVSPTGSGSLCTAGSPCALTTANNDANPGDFVLLTPGTYGVPINPVRSGDSLSGRIVYMGNAANPNQSVVSSVDLAGKSFVTVKWTRINGSITIQSSGSVNSYKDSIYDIRSTGSLFTGGALRCWITECDSIGDGLGSGGGAASGYDHWKTESLVGTPKYLHVRNNQFNIGASGGSVGTDIRGFWLAGMESSYVVNNLVIVKTAGLSGGANSFHPRIYFGIRNNVFSGNHYRDSVTTSVGADYQFNLRDNVDGNLFENEQYYDVGSVPLRVAFATNGQSQDNNTFNNVKWKTQGYFVWNCTGGATNNSYNFCQFIARGVRSGGCDDPSTLVCPAFYFIAGTYSGLSFRHCTMWSGNRWLFKTVDSNPGFTSVTLKQNIYSSKPAGACGSGPGNYLIAFPSGSVNSDTSLYMTYGGSATSVTYDGSCTTPDSAGSVFTSGGHDGKSRYGNPGFADTAWATIDLTPAENGMADVMGADGYVGAIAPAGTVVDVTAPAQITTLVDSTRVSPATTVVMKWTEVGDDGTTGTATSYDLRYSQSTITEGNWGSATQIGNEPAPGLAGRKVGCPVQGLAYNTVFYFAMKVTDDAGNVSALSNVDSVLTLPAPDTTPPEAIDDLGATYFGNGLVELSWTAPGDDGAVGTPAFCEIRYAASQITNEDTWSSASDALFGAGPLIPQSGGGQERMQVGPLATGATYYFCVRCTDDDANRGAISNSPSAEVPADPTGDIIRPAAVSDLTDIAPRTAFSTTKQWTVTGDDSLTGTPAAAILKWRVGSTFVEANWAGATTVNGMPPISSSGQVQTKNVLGLPTNTVVAFAMKIQDEEGNLSALSNVDTTICPSSVDVTAPTAINSLKDSSRTSTSVVMRWVCTADDAAAFQLVYRTGGAVTSGNYDASTVWAPSEAISPGNAGNMETINVTGLAANTIYYFGIKTQDEAGNLSAVSNSDSVETPSNTVVVEDPTTIPGIPLNVAVEYQTDVARWQITWTEPADDGYTGTAVLGYQVRWSHKPITAYNWDRATPVLGTPDPVFPGLTTGMTFEAPNFNQVYIAVRAIDKELNFSGVSSNVVTNHIGSLYW